MKIKALHPNFRMPTKGSEHAAGFDLYMPEKGIVLPRADYGVSIALGFAAEVPAGHVALLLPRSGAGAKHGLSLNNTCGVIDSDYRGEWMASVRIHNNKPFKWEAGERLFQVVIVPVPSITLEQVDELSDTSRGEGGFGSSGK